MRFNSFAFRVIKPWNSLPAHVVESENVSIFQARLNRAITSKVFDVGNYVLRENL